MRSPARLLPAVLACTFALAACGSQPSGDASGGSGSTAADGTSELERATAVPTTGIPDDFPLTAGMGGPTDSIPTSRTGTGLRDLELCGTSPLRGLGTRDRMVADNSGGESADTRELLLLGSPDAAGLVAQAFADLPSTCDGSAGTGDVATVTEVRGSTFGEAPAAVLVQGYVFDGDPGPGHLVVHVVPVGSALLVTRTYGEWPEVAEGVDQTTASVAETVAAMVVFAEAEAPTGTPTETASSSAIPDDFPMLAGWPRISGDGEGRVGPTRDADPLVFTVCGKTSRDPAHADRVTAQWDDAEDYRLRQLTTYADEVAAVDAVEALVGLHEACPTEPPGDDGYGTEREVRPVALGDEAWAILERDTLDGRPSPFGESAMVVRVGRAVLVVLHGGHAGYPDGNGQGQVEAMGSQAATPIAMMCQFTKTGC
jgi:hypothetical protein